MKVIIRRTKRPLVLVALLWLAAVPSVQAHRDDYLDETIVYLTLEQSELEIEYWIDGGRDREYSTDFYRHHAAAEWGITKHWMVDGRITIKSVEGDNTKLDGGRLETRCRFAEEGVLPVDVALSTEVNWERDEEDKIVPGVEPRAILSKDIHEKLNLTLNLSEEILLESGRCAFLVAGGIRYNWTDLLRLGTEWHHNTEEGGGSVIPQIWFAFRSGLTLKIGYSGGYGRNREDYGRIALEAEF